MSKIKKSDFILVFDRYFSKKPNAFLSWLKRTLYCCAECACMMLCLLEIYKIPANTFAAALCCVFSTVFFCALFAFVKKRYAVPAVLLAVGAAVYLFRDTLWGMLKYFLDALMIALDGPVFSLMRYLYHGSSITSYISESAISFILTLAAFVMSMICAAAMFKKPSGAPPLITFIILFLPMLVARKLSFGLWAVPTAALLLGGFAMAKAFSSGVITRGGVYAGCRGALLREERSFGKQIAKAPAIKRAKLGAVHYSKYFSASLCAAAVFTLAGFVGAAVMNDKVGIDYSPVYEFFSNIGKQMGGIAGTANNSGSDNDNFPGSGNFSLSVTSPEKGEGEILSVINTGEKVYLRGDIGVDFNGIRWTSPVDAEKNEMYLPNEIHRLYFWDHIGNEYFPEIAERMKSYGIESSHYSADMGRVIVEYIAKTDVAFLPAYMYRFDSFYYSGFYHYGDYVLRLGGESIDRLVLDSYVPSLNYTGEGFAEKEIIMEMLDAIANCDFMDYNNTYSDMKIRDVKYPDYVDYVRRTYLNVPENTRDFLKDFLISNELYTDSTDNLEIYKKCIDITDFLKNRYTYSLDTDNGSENPVMTFLTETKSGHCALYASAMTLMLRTMGVPARYCTGFIAPHTLDNSAVVLKSKDFHAWCEVYFEKIGWITFDPTSSAVSSALGGENESSVLSDSESTEDSESGSESLESVESSEPQDESTEDDSGISSAENGEDSDSDNGKVSVNILPFVCSTAAVILTAAIVWTVIRKLKMLDSMAKKALYEAKDTGNCEELYAKMIAVLKLCKFKQNIGEQPETFFARADSRLNTKLSENIETLMKIAFGKGQFTDTERLAAARLLNELFDAADARLFAVGRVKLRKIIIGKPQK